MARTRSEKIPIGKPAPVKELRLKIPPMGGKGRISTSIPFADRGRTLGAVARMAFGKRR